MSTPYKPGNPSSAFTPQQQQWLASEHNNLFKALEGAKKHETYAYLHAQPARMVAGMWVLADGDDWDPGSGVGAYRRSEDNTEWVFVGSDVGSIALAVAASEASLQVIASELQRLTFLQSEQLRQTTKVALLLSAMSGLSIDDNDVPIDSTPLAQLTATATILSILSGVVIEGEEILIPTY